MANRSTFNSSLPRDVKRLLLMSSVKGGWSKNQLHRECQDWAKAHAHHKEVVRKRLSMKGNVDVEEAVSE
jgi:hypothetical protein